MRFLVQGIGSIGQRHYRNARLLGHEAAILRSSTAERPFIKDFFDAERAAGNEPLVFTDLDTAIAEWHPDALIIGLPNHLHAAPAMEAATRGLHILIEKPVSNIKDGLEELAKIAEEKKLTALVGYNLRFHPLLARVKHMCDAKELGTILSAAVEVGENIIDWHPWEDYRDTYAPWVKTGGGALLCFSHDIDYLYWILGMPDVVATGGGKVTPLEGDAEDLVESLWSYADKRVATLHVDYFQRPKVRTLKIIGTKKTVLWDAYASLSIWDHEIGEGTLEEVPTGFERNDMFLEELRHFAACIEGKESPLTPLSEGIAVLDLVDRMKAALTHST